MAGRLIDTDPDLIIQRYRKRADDYRRLADGNVNPKRCLRLAAIFDSLAEGMMIIVRRRRAPLPVKDSTSTDRIADR
jgi:hypothetical protein